MFNAEEKSILAIHENLNVMGFNISLENLAKMKPTELKKFHKKAVKAFDRFWSVQRVVAQLSLDENAPDAFTAAEEEEDELSLSEDKILKGF